MQKVLIANKIHTCSAIVNPQTGAPSDRFSNMYQKYVLRMGIGYGDQLFGVRIRSIQFNVGYNTTKLACFILNKTKHLEHFAQ